MPDEWIVRVEGQEYGPVDIDALRDWKREGRLIPTNEVRRVGDEHWIRAGELVEVFADAEPAQPPPLVQPPSRSLWQILHESFRLYCRGFSHFLVLTLVTALPSVCAQLSAPAVALPANAVPDLQMASAAGFSCMMLLLSLALWPVFLAGIQIATAELMAGRPLSTFDLLRRAIFFWLRVAPLCLFVYGSYFFWTALPLVAMLAIMAGGPSLLSFFLVLVLLAFQVWITARLFTNFLFWQQFAVIEGLDIGGALRQSKELGRSGQDRLWHQRPLWRGALLASLWCAVVILFNIGPLSEMFQTYFHQMEISPDPQSMLQALSNAKPQSPGYLTVALGLLQIVLRPILGISFVVLYYDARARSGRMSTEEVSSEA